MFGRKFALLAACTALASIPVSGSAQLSTGVRAPTFTTQGALAGQTFTFDLQRSLRNGPVVLYFYPKAFTQGCTLEANAFAEAMDDFEAAGATVVGMSADDLPTLRRFSTEECRDEFAVAVASSQIISAYDVAFVMNGQDTGLSDRTSYVINTDGRIEMAYSNLDWSEHVSRTLSKVQELKRRGS
jgi:peroxiredoxin